MFDELDQAEKSHYYSAALEIGTFSRGGRSVNTIAAVVRNGMFAPDSHINFAEGARVMLHVEVAPPSASINPSETPPLPDSLWETEEHSTPCDLPMGCGTPVAARDASTLFPDPPIYKPEGV